MKVHPLGTDCTVSLAIASENSPIQMSLAGKPDVKLTFTGYGVGVAVGVAVGVRVGVFVGVAVGVGVLVGVAVLVGVGVRVGVLVGVGVRAAAGIDIPASADSVRTAPTHKEVRERPKDFLNGNNLSGLLPSKTCFLTISTFPCRDLS